MNLYGYEITVNDDHFIIDEKIVNFVKNNLTENRYNHSYSVAILCYEIAIKNNLKDPLKYFLLGFLHDVGKYTNDEKSIKIMKKYFKEYLNLPSYTYHSFVGSKMIEDELKINDEEFLEAIMFHTTGNSNLSDLAIVLFAADKIEPTRKYNSYDLILKMFKNYKVGFKDVLIEVNKFLKSQNCEDNELSKSMYKFYIKDGEMN